MERNLSLRSQARRACVLFVLLLMACGDAEHSDAPTDWSILTMDRPGALLSVFGRAPDDVFVVGGDQGEGRGPTVLRFDGHDFESLQTGVAEGNLWWVTGVEDGPLFMGGDQGLLLRYQDQRFERMETPSTGTIYGLWAPSADDVWAVGGFGATGAFVWRLQDRRWQPASGFAELRGSDGQPLETSASLRKVWGTGPSDVWIAGTAGITLHYDGSGFELQTVPHQEDLITVHATGDHVVAVGGIGSGVIYEHAADGWRDVTPDGAPELNGVWLQGDGGYAVGGSGVVYRREAGSWRRLDVPDLVTEDLHSVWVDARGCVFAAGGRWRAYPLKRGVLLHGCR